MDSESQYDPIPNSGCMQGLVVQDASSRGLLWVRLVLEALERGRPCVLITALDPGSDEFDWVIERAENADLLRAALDDGRVMAFTAIGDYGFNLFRLGANGLLRELDKFGLKSGSVVVVDQAEDFFTPHDPAATLRQVSHYRQWCNQRQHQLALLFLRSSPERPPLGGNQAALSYFNALFNASVRRSGLHLQSLMSRDELAIGLDGYARHALADGSMGRELEEVVDFQALFAAPRPPSVRPDRPAAWYVGSYLGEVSKQWPQFAWRCASDINDLMSHETAVDVIVVDFDGELALREFSDRLAVLRQSMASTSRLVVRETAGRIREFPQRRLLKAVGVDDFSDRYAPLPATDGQSPASDTAKARSPLEIDQLLSLVDGGTLSNQARGLTLSEFVDQALERLEINERLGFPCTLAELSDTASLSVALDRADLSIRPGDLFGRAQSSGLWLLQGCPASEAVRVVHRVLEMVGAPGVGAISLFSDVESIVQRLSTLTPVVAVAAEPETHRDDVRELEAETPFDRAYREGRYSDAAALAQQELVTTDPADRPLDEEFCFRLGESLELIGQFSSAERHYRLLLDGSSRMSEARAALVRIGELQATAVHGMSRGDVAATGQGSDMFNEEAVTPTPDRLPSSGVALSAKARSIRQALQQTWRQGESDGIVPT